MKRVLAPLLCLVLPLWLVTMHSGCGKKEGKGGGDGGKGGGVSRLNGGGSTFVGPMMKRWATVYYKEKGVEVDYALKGSGNGIQQMTSKTYHFGCTDAPMTEEQLKKARDTGGEVVHIPLVMGAVVPIYNLAELGNNVKALNFTGPVLADIFLGKITKWNDAALKKINPGVELPDKNIVVVHRAEPSGTTFIWTDYLAQVSPDWKKEVGEGRIEIKWPTGVGKPGNDGVAGHVAKAPGAIGYVEMLYALNNKMPYGAVQNKDQTKFIHAKTENVTAAAKAAAADIPDGLTYTLTNKPGSESYPICGTV